MQSKLAAFKIFRRSATATIFSNRGLEFIDIKHLSNDPAKATETLNRFVAWILESFRPELSALGTDEEDNKPRTAMLTSIVEGLLRQHGIPIWRVADKDLLDSFATPALTQKHELRQIARSLWPQVVTEEQIPALDAALIGLYVQTERLLSDH
jgi:hypothetical protein